MTSIPLRMNTVRSYLGSNHHNSCQDISKIHIRSNEDGSYTVEARIPASTTSQRDYSIRVNISGSGSRISGTSCSCPVGYKCKHINKVLRRIVSSTDSPLPVAGPNTRRQEQDRQFARGAYVYLAISCQSEIDSGSDYRRSHTCKSNFNQEILGLFFSLRKANQCARDFVVDELDQELDEDLLEDDTEFVWDGSDYEAYDGNTFDKVWVESRPIEDASSRFHK